MKYKNILLHLDNSSGCRNRLEVAFGLAQKFDASLTGMLVVPTYVVPSYIEAQISVDVMTDVTEKALARARDTVSGYQQLAAKAGVHCRPRWSKVKSFRFCANIRSMPTC